MSVPFPIQTCRVSLVDLCLLVLAATIYPACPTRGGTIHQIHSINDSFASGSRTMWKMNISLLFMQKFLDRPFGDCVFLLVEVCYELPLFV